LKVIADVPPAVIEYVMRMGRGTPSLLLSPLNVALRALIADRRGICRPACNRQLNLLPRRTVRTKCDGQCSS